MKQNENAIFVQIVERPARKLILKRGREATHYFQYCDEVGCDVWGILSDIKEALYEPIGLWLPSLLRPAGTSEYAQGVEVALDYQGIIPEGFEIMDLSPCTMMIFQGPPFEDEKFCEAIEALCIQIEKFNPEIYGYRWNDEIAPRFQLEPQGYRGYIEGRPVSRI